MLALVMALVACGPTYDAENDCRQTRACLASIGESPPNTLESCVAQSEAAYDNATDAQRQLVDDAYARCMDYESCAYLRCVLEGRP